MVLDQLDQGVSGTFHSNAALHNSLQKERCIVFSRMMGTAASGQVTADKKKALFYHGLTAAFACPRSANWTRQL
jgi:hypothetical protein